MIVGNIEELKVICNFGGLKGIKKGEYYIPFKSKILCKCDDCGNEFYFHYITAIKQKEHFCINCRYKGKRNGMYNKGYLFNGKNNPFYGKKHSEESKRKISEKVSGLNNPFYGKHHTEKTKEKLRCIDKSYMKTETYKKNMSNIVKGRKHSDEVKHKISVGNKKSLYNRKFNCRSNLEKEFEQKYLIEKLNLKKNIDYIIQKRLKYKDSFRFYDFYIIKDNLLIEIDGDYWHSLEHHIKNDKIKNELAKENGFKLLRIKEKDINKYLL